jgi:hypothetical protein
MAETILRVFLRADEAETESGDLLEAYRDSIYPTRGRWRADFWFVRQVASYVLRASVPWGLLLGLVWVVGPFRMLLARTGWGVEVEPKLIAVTMFLLAARRAWRSGQIRAGILLAIAIGAVGSLVWIAGDIFQAARWDTSVAAVQSLRLNLDWGVFMIPVLSLAGATVLGTAGASIGKLLRTSARRQSI